ncbi:MAG: hypothetical protein IH846_07735 [Acidobacteria bacterium]|nr:hypothetical protein [Acidobacteriota bacterium]
MRKMQYVIAAILLSMAGSYWVLAQDAPMGFFVTSTGPGNGANLGGLAGADRHCQMLAAAAGAGDRTWRAYLSTSASGGQAAVNARDRIGQGPWHNAKGVRIAPNVADLHGDIERDRNYLYKDTALNEKGEVVNGRGDRPNRHDILTGSDSHGRTITGSDDRTCQNWTSSDTGQAQVGHHDRSGGNTTSWNSAHTSRGCSQEALQGSGGDGLFYCFAGN